MILDGKIKAQLLRTFICNVLLIKLDTFLLCWKTPRKVGSSYPLLNNILCSFQYESDEQEKGAYQEYDSDSDVPEELKQDYVDEQTGDAPVKRYLFLEFMVFLILCCTFNIEDLLERLRKKTQKLNFSFGYNVMWQKLIFFLNIFIGV